MTHAWGPAHVSELEAQVQRLVDAAEARNEQDKVREQAAHIEGMREALGRLKQAFTREAAISAIEAEIAALERGGKSEPR